MSIIVQDVYNYEGLDENYLAEELATLWVEEYKYVGFHGS